MSAGRLGRLERITGRLAFAASLSFWLARSWSRLPYDFMDLSYLLSLEQGRHSIAEWMHPLYLPLLTVYRTILAACGYHGRMLLPVERLNVLAGAATLTLLFVLAERRARRAWPAAAASLLLGFSTGFWTGCLRSTPYAWAVAALVLFAAALLSERPLAAGLAAGAAAGFHLGLIALLPAAAVTIRREKRALLLLAAGWTSMLALAYAFFLWTHPDALTSLSRLPFRQFLSGVEQVPGTSLWSDPRPLALLKDWSATLWRQGAPLLYFLPLLPLALIRGQRRDARLAALCFLSISGFFLINNTRNGLVFSALALVPLGLASAASGAAWLRWAVPALALWSCTDASAKLVKTPRSGPADPILVESRFLASALRPGDLLLVPGCPFPEMAYLAPLPILPVVASRAQADLCDLPAMPASELPEVVSSLAADGGRVYYPESASPADLGRDVSGSWKERQIFLPFPAPAPMTPRRQEGLTSPQGRTYFRLTAGSAAAAPTIPGWIGDEALSALERRGPLDLDYRRRLDYLAALLPSFDPRARRMLVEKTADLEALLDAAARGAQDQGRLSEALRVLDWAVARFPRDAGLRNDRGVAEAMSGKTSEAVADLKRALALEPGRLESYVSLGQLYSAQGKKSLADAVLREAARRARGKTDLDPELKALLDRAN